MSSLFDLTDQVALVTGSGFGGLGGYAAIALAEAGCNVAVADLPSREEDLALTVKKITEKGRQGLPVFLDITDEESVNEAVEQVLERFGKIDILVNFAGAMLRKPTIETSLPEWEEIIDINLTGTFLICKRVGKELLKRSRGKVINIASLYGNMVGPIPEPAYYASKAGVVNLTRGLAAEWGEYNIQVNAIGPGVFYPTNFTKPLKDQPGRLEEMKKRTLLGRLGDPKKDLAGVVVFLASPAADYITGQFILVDGGWSAW